MRAEFTMSLSQRMEVMAVPREAIQGDHYQPHVFIKDFEIPDAFIKARVVTGSQNDQYVEIVRGLLPGDEVVTRGAYPLSFAGKGGISLKEAWMPPMATNTTRMARRSPKSRKQPKPFLKQHLKVRDLPLVGSGSWVACASCSGSSWPSSGETEPKSPSKGLQASCSIAL